MRRLEELQTLTRCFKTVTTNKASVSAWIELARVKLIDSANPSISFSTRLEACYDAIFNIAQCVLMAKGFRISSDAGHHRFTLEAVCSEIGATETLWDMVDAIRELRNNKYAGIPGTENDYRDANNAAHEFIQCAMAWLERQHSQLLR